MSFRARTYETIVRDILTTLTHGTVRETIPVPDPQDGEIVLAKLKDRPVRRVSHVEEIRIDDNGVESRVRFLPADFELVASGEDEDVKDVIRFREGRKQPFPGSTLIVNYYPVETDPVPLDDLNVGSVIRTMMETFSRELAMTELNLEFVYNSAFLETATRNSLDKVVALVGMKRLPAGHPVVKVQFKRKPQTPGQITIPVGTAVADSENNRYLTLSTLVLEANESVREVLAGGEGPATKLVEEGQLNRLEVLIAGISEVTNLQPARQLAAPETDEELRRRARGALHGVVRGTLDALKFGILSIPGVKNVSLQEFPNNVAGEVRIEVAFSEDTPEVRRQVEQKIRELKPAGIRVIQGDAARKRVQVRLELTLAGTGVPESDIVQLKSGIEEKISGYLTGIPPGGTARRAKLSALVLEDGRIVDARVLLVPEGQEPAEDLSLNTGEIIEVAKPFNFVQIVPEEFPETPAGKAKISGFLPVHLVEGVTAEEAENAIRLAFESFLTTRNQTASLTVDAMIAALRDESRYGLVRAETLITIEVGERFLQLSDGVGEYRPAENETLEADEVNIDIREGNV